MRLFEQIVPKPGVRQADEVQGPVPGGLAFEVDHSVFGGQIVRVHAGGGDHRAAGKAGHNAGHLAVVGGGVKGNDGLAAFGVKGPRT